MAALRKELQSYSLTMCPVVWKASSTIVSSWSEAAWWNTEKMFFQPERMLAAWEFTIWATHLITMSLIVGDLGGGMVIITYNIHRSLATHPPILQYSLPVLLHDVLKRPEKVFLEAEVGQLSFLQELHGELPQWVHSKDGYILIGVTAHLEEDRAVIKRAPLCITCTLVY